MHTSLTPAILSNEEAQGFIDRYNTIKEFWTISQNLFKKSLTDDSLKDIRDLVLNEVNSEFSLNYHKKLYEGEIQIPYFFRTDEAIPGKITEIQAPGSLWGDVHALQTSLPYMKKFANFPIRSFNKLPIAEKVSSVIKELTSKNPLIFHQIDESSNMQDMNYFISVTRKYGLKYLGYDHEASFKNVNFIRTHSFMEEVTGSTFFEFLENMIIIN